MKKTLFASLFVVLIAALAAVLYLQSQTEPEAEAEPEQSAPPIASAPEPEPAPPRYPIPPPPPPPVPSAPSPASEQPAPTPAPPPPEPVPTLDKSDTALISALGELLGRKALQSYLRLDDIVRRIVVSIDNLPRPKLARRQFILEPVGGSFKVSGEEGAWVMDPANAERYTPYVQLLSGLDTQRLVDQYVHFYPVFQSAYQELGYPDGYFNDRLVAVIDHLLATPQVTEPIKLVRPHVFYQYADPDLEALSVGQKMLIRMGPANAGQVKDKLRELRAAVTR